MNRYTLIQHSKRPTLLREGLLEDTLVKTAEGRAEVLGVRETERLVPGLQDGQVVLGLRGGRRRLGGLLETHGLGRRLRVATHLQDRGQGTDIETVRRTKNTTNGGIGLKIK